jgi:hypothetical protein
VLYQGSSLLALSRLPVRPTFDVAYIDGDHSALGAVLDTCLVWPLVKPGGIVAFDDWTHPRFRTFPRLVAALLGAVPHEVLAENEQLWVRKLSFHEHPAAGGSPFHSHRAPSEVTPENAI